MYKKVIGLEVHVQLLTRTKLFSPIEIHHDHHNQYVGNNDYGYPGTLPVFNKKVLDDAILLCHTLHMTIDKCIRFDRKNYYYSDLPKGYQITQQNHPIGKNGYLQLKNGKVIEIERLHIEEDTAKQKHQGPYTYIDYNRAGIPLLEIVTKPCIDNEEDAVLYLETLRLLLLYLGLSDGRLEEGSMRCDINISINHGTRTEIKNLNSLSNVSKAIIYEYERQKTLLENHREVIQETRRYDEDLKETVLMRSKGNTYSYKYYPEPNLLPISITDNYIYSLIKTIPMLPEDYDKLYQSYGLKRKERDILIKNIDMNQYFMKVIKYTTSYTRVFHILNGELMSLLNTYHSSYKEVSLNPSYLSDMIDLLEKGIISSKQMKSVLEHMYLENLHPDIIIEKYDLKTMSANDISKIITQVLDENRELIKDYKNGKDHVLGYFIGQVMKKTKGKANGSIAKELLLEMIDEKY